MIFSVNWSISPSSVALNHLFQNVKEKLLVCTTVVLPKCQPSLHQLAVSGLFCQCAEILSWANVVATTVSGIFKIWLQNIINTCDIKSRYFNLLPQGQLPLPTPFLWKFLHRWSNTSLWFRNEKKNVNTCALHLHLPQITFICPWSCHLPPLKLCLVAAFV